MALKFTKDQIKDYVAAMPKTSSGPPAPPHVVSAPVQTIVIWCNAGVRFFVVPGDHSHLNQKFMDSSGISYKISEDIFNLAYEETKKGKVMKVTMTPIFPVLSMHSNTKVIVTGYLP